MTTSTESVEGLADGTPPRPEVQPPEGWRFATPARDTLGNGIELLSYDIPGQYVISVRTVLPFPLSVEPREVEGVATIMARLLDEGTAEHSPEEFAELLERKGIALGASVTDGGLGVDLDVPKRHLGDALDLLRQALAEPVFPEPEVDRHRKTRLAQIEQERALAPQRAAQAFIATHFDEGDRASRPTAGTTSSITALTREDIVAFHAERVGPTGMTAVIAGDLSGLDVRELAEATLGTWVSPTHVPAPGPTEARRAQDAARVVFVDRPGSVQTELLVGWTGPDRRAPAGWAAYPVLGFMVGGSPNARIDAVLREEKGYTYGIRSVFRPRRVGGLFLTSGSVRADATVEAVRLLLDLLASGRDGFSAEEVRSGVDFISKTAPGRFATADAVADEAATMALDGLTTDFTSQTLEAMRDLDGERLTAAYREWVQGEWTVVIVGDASTYADGVRELGIGDVTVVPA
ncbi:putative Zn-dependent peptidase [Phycicoccus badiiscoriae]|uniref:Putative Zn-dependent peptidase n=1 Tax=Pedococcus badiiscoriae TaxID=642776 RepID=A0A852WA51_9MICO|nr:pitrilysin family protein [Pedococcus badiiscoriae]NYG06107.1 putative Zn-dependent peptidase [Pedococcus badiiscoriae]